MKDKRLWWAVAVIVVLVVLVVIGYAGGWFGDGFLAPEPTQ